MGTNFNESITEFCDSLVFTTSKFNNLRELKTGEQIFFTTFSMYRYTDEYDVEKIYYEFGTATLESLPKIAIKNKKKKDLELLKFVGFYKSNNPNNCKVVAAYYILLYRLNSEINVYNKKIDSIIF